MGRVAGLEEAVNTRDMVFAYGLLSKAGQFNPGTDKYPAHYVLLDGSVITLEAVERCEDPNDLYKLMHLGEAVPA